MFIYMQDYIAPDLEISYPSSNMSFNYINKLQCLKRLPVHVQASRCSSNLVSDNDYQFLQQSKVPTLHFQPSLPRLPIPDLQKTCERYLAAQKPLLSLKDFDVTKGYVDQFRTDGNSLHSELKSIDKRNKHTSYISELWFDMYLSDRIPLPINYNPLVVLNNDDRKEYNSQAVRASNMLISSLRFLKSLRQGILEPEVFHLNPKKSDTDLFRTITGLLPSSLSWYGAYLFKAYPLDMVQYSSLFNSSRIPGIGKDKLVKNEAAKHILIMKGGNFYIFDAIDSNGNILNPRDIFTCIKYIIDEKTDTSEYPVGVLTTENRDTWALARQHLESLGNSEVLNLIDSSLFNLSLDDIAVGSDRNLMLRTLLHGDGKNRWFDKSFSLLMSKDGVAAINFDHSWGDGVAVLRFIQETFKDTTKKPRIHSNTNTVDCSPDEMVRKLEFKLDDKAKNYIHDAKKKYERFYNSLSLNIFEFPGFGRKLCKKHRISPDSVMQLGFQLAFYKQTSKFVPTYESCSTAAFRHGRTETIRPCTTATKEFCEAVCSNKSNNSDLKHLLQKCSEHHVQLTKEAAMGQGFDRHLFALRKIAEMKGKIPAVFQDPAYQSINKNIISTSTLNSEVVMAGAFGPVVQNGYGIGYTILEDFLGCIVSNYPPHRDGIDFVECLKSSFEELYKILLKNKN